MVKIELDIEGISWYIETTLETDTVPAVGDIIIVDKDCISERDSAELWKTPSNQVFKWADEEDDAPVMVWFDCETEMLVTKRTWKYDIEEEETVCILGVNLFTMRIYSCDIRFYHSSWETGYGNVIRKA